MGFGSLRTQTQDTFNCFGTAWSVLGRRWDGIWDGVKCKQPNVYRRWDGGTAWTGGISVSLPTESTTALFLDTESLPLLRLLALLLPPLLFTRPFHRTKSQQF